MQVSSALSGPRTIVLGEHRRGMKWYEFKNLTEEELYIVNHPSARHSRRIYPTTREYMKFRHKDDVLLDIFVTQHANEDDEHGEYAHCVMDAHDPTKAYFFIDPDDDILVKVIIRNRLQTSVQILPLYIDADGTEENRKDATLEGDAGDFKYAMSKNVTHELDTQENANGGSYVVDIIDIAGKRCDNINFTLAFKTNLG